MVHARRRQARVSEAMTQKQQQVAGLIAAAGADLPRGRVAPKETAQRWADSMRRFMTIGILCRGCGYRVPPGSWLAKSERFPLLCPHCYTPMGYR